MDKAAAAAIFTPAARAALAAFPIDSDRVELVAVSENVTFRVGDRRDGADYVLRLHRPGYHTDAALNAERIWTRALAEAGVAVPIPVLARDGRDYVSVAVEALGERRQAGVTRWVEGEILSDRLEHTDEAAVLARWFGQLGGLVARMHNQSSAWRPPPDFTRHAVDRDGLMGEAPFWGPFWDHPVFSPYERRLVLATRDRIREAMDRYGQGADRFGVIHADLHPGNVLVAGDGLTVIDFDDAAFGWHMYDIAVALFFQRGSPHFPAIRDAFLAGYRAHRPLDETALAMLPTFLLTRALAQIGWLGQRPEIDVSASIKGMKDQACAECAAFDPPD
jgi:Ser/Thr protein kinase RdoA (MazF antagonist)